MTREALIALLEPEVVALGYELVDLEFRPSGKEGLLRLYIDGPDGVNLDDCERVSHQVSALLDVEDPIPGHYSLEVSSPGLDRVLRTAEHFRRFAGNRVKLQLAEGVEGRRRFTGTLLGLEQDEVLLEVDGENLRLPLSGVEKARLVPQF